MDIRKLQRAIVDGLEDVKAQQIVVFNTEALSPLFERVIIASGASNRQTKALAANVRDVVRQRGMQVLRTEGEENGEWIIVDCGAAVAHIMQPAIREYYHLEELWGTKPIKLKAAPVRGLVKAEEPAKAPRKTAATSAVRAAKSAAPAPGVGRSAKATAAPTRAAAPARSRAKPRAPEPVFAPVHPSYKAPPQTLDAATAKPKAVGRNPVRRASPVAPSKGTSVRAGSAVRPMKPAAKKSVAKKVGKSWVAAPAATKAAAPKTGTPRAANPHTPAPKRKAAATKRAAAPSFTGGAPRKTARGGKTPR
jgi:ribosome-associated protein